MIINEKKFKCVSISARGSIMHIYDDMQRLKRKRRKLQAELVTCNDLAMAKVVLNQAIDELNKQIKEIARTIIRNISC
jgi:hypothetical protein